MIVSSARACDSRSRRSALGFSLRPKIDSGNRLRRGIEPSIGIVYLDVRQGAYQRIGLAGPPIPPSTQLDQRWPHGEAHNCRVDQYGHGKCEPEDLYQHEIAERERGEHDDHDGSRAGDESAGARQTLDYRVVVAKPRSRRLRDARDQEYLV